MSEKKREELNEATKENIQYIINQIKERLKVVNTAALNAESFDTEAYEDLLDLYDYIKMKDKFSSSEMQSIVSELGKLRK